MSMAPIYQTLINDTEIHAAFGDRMFPTAAPLKTPVPYLVWQGIGSSAENNIDCGATNDHKHLQFTIWDTDAYRAEQLRLKVSQKLNDAGFYYLGENPDNYDEKTALHGRGWDMNFWLDR